jgi:hypothetical protein
MVPSSCCPCIHGREETRALWTAHRGVLGVVERCQIVACKRLLTKESRLWPYRKPYQLPKLICSPSPTSSMRLRKPLLAQEAMFKAPTKSQILTFYGNTQLSMEILN